MENLKPDDVLRICNKCGYEWYSSIAKERDLSALAGGNALSQLLDIAATDFQASSQRSRNIDALDQQLNDLKRCPKCGSYDCRKVTADSEVPAKIEFDENAITMAFISFALLFIIPLVGEFVFKVEETLYNMFLMFLVWLAFLIVSIIIKAIFFTDELTKLMENVQNNKIEEVSKIATSANINFLHKKGFTPLLLSVFQSFYDMSKLLIEKGANVNMKNSAGNTPLEIAVATNNNELVKLLIKHGADVNASGNSDKSPLLLAISNQAPDIVWALLENGADINAKMESNGYTPIHNAIEKNNIIAVRLLIKKGADVSIKENSGKTPLDLAIFKGNAQIIDLLKAKEAELIKDKEVQGNRILASLKAKNTKTNSSESSTFVISDNEKECPFCAEIIKKKAKLCRFCNSALEA